MRVSVRRFAAAALSPSPPSPWAVNIGLEVHAQISAASKLFSGASAEYGAASWTAGPNAAVAAFDAALPGTLPALNRRCVEAAVTTALALQCTVHRRSVFERKHYFYADLPLGFQITQLRHPIASNGCVVLTVPRSWKRAKGSVMDVFERRVRIDRIQLEQDSGKSSHTLSDAGTLVDLNRAGVPLMEIVTHPDLTSAAEAGAFLRALQRLLRHVSTCDGNMEAGSMRCDVNVSLRPSAPDGANAVLGQRVEMKNLNSVKAVMRAIEHEVERQSSVLARGGVVEGETRSFDAASGVTARLRGKEDTPDYRFFPEPDLPPVELSEAFVADVAASVPELPPELQARLVADFGLSPYDASVLVAEVGAAELLLDVVHRLGPATRVDVETATKSAANLIVNSLFGLLNERNASVQDGDVTAAQLAALLRLVHDGTVSAKAAKDVLALMVAGDPCAHDPAAIVEREGWTLLTDEAAVRELCVGVLQDPAAAEAVAKYVDGNDRVFGSFVGKVMAASAGRADPKLVNQALREELQLLRDAHGPSV